MSDRREMRRTEETAGLGRVTLGGDPAGVYLGGERRWLPVYAPGGYRWRPGAGDQVLVVRAGDKREAPCIAGVRQQPGELEPGEVRISGGAGSVRLCGQGIVLSGQVRVNGKTLDEYIETAVRAALAAAAGG